MYIFRIHLTYSYSQIYSTRQIYKLYWPPKNLFNLCNVNLMMYVYNKYLYLYWWNWKYSQRLFIILLIRIKVIFGGYDYELTIRQVLQSIPAFLSTEAICGKYSKGGISFQGGNKGYSTGISYDFTATLFGNPLYRWPSMFVQRISTVRKN